MIAVASWGDNYHSWIAGGVIEYELETLRFLSSAGCNSWFSYHSQPPSSCRTTGVHRGECCTIVTRIMITIILNYIKIFNHQT